jgi:hypothetical protein
VQKALKCQLSQHRILDCRQSDACAASQSVGWQLSDTKYRISWHIRPRYVACAGQMTLSGGEGAICEGVSHGEGGSYMRVDTLWGIVGSDVGLGRLFVWLDFCSVCLSSGYGATISYTVDRRDVSLCLGLILLGNGFQGCTRLDWVLRDHF